MIKSELVARLAQRYPHLYHRDVERIVTTVLDEITKALAQGHRVELRGFGAFSVKVRPARMGRNPRTGEPVSVDEKRAPFFRTGKELRERLNGGLARRTVRLSTYLIGDPGRRRDGGRRDRQPPDRHLQPGSVLAQPSRRSDVGAHAAVRAACW